MLGAKQALLCGSALKAKQHGAGLTSRGEMDRPIGIRMCPEVKKVGRSIFRSALMSVETAERGAGGRTELAWR